MPAVVARGPPVAPVGALLPREVPCGPGLGIEIPMSEATALIARCAGAGNEFVAAAAAVAPSNVTAPIAAAFRLSTPASRDRRPSGARAPACERNTSTIAATVAVSRSESVVGAGTAAFWTMSATSR